MAALANTDIYKVYLAKSISIGLSHFLLTNLQMGVGYFSFDTEQISLGLLVLTQAVSALERLREILHFHVL